MSKLDELVSALEARRNGKWWMARCPAHDDRTPSLGLLDNGNNGVLLKCFAGCTHSDVIIAVENKYGIAATQKATATPQLVTPIPDCAPNYALHLFIELGPPTSHFIFRNVDGEALMFKCRWDHSDGTKEFRPLTLWKNEQGELEWQFQAMPPQRPLYNLDQLAARTDAPVLIVEGEKTADAASTVFSSYVVTTWQDGARPDKIKLADWSPLEGREIVIWPDADSPGQAASSALAKAVDAAGAKLVRTVQLPEGLPKGWDLADDPGELDQSPEELINAAIEVDPTLARYVLTARELIALDVPEREFIIEPWLPCMGLAMIFAKRGMGKTYLALSMAIEIAKGQTKFLGHYNIPKARRVLYIDGELPLAELQSRMQNYCSTPPDNLFLLSSEQLFRNGVSLNVHDKECQNEINMALKRLEAQGRSPDLIVIDSLSTLSSGAEENDNTALDQLIKWLMELRHQGYSVLMLHHAGKSGDQRGASRREDYLDTSIKLDSPDTDTPHEGAHFMLTFSKIRGRHPQPDELDCKLEQNENKIFQWTIDAASNIPARVVVLRKIFELKPKTQKDLAAILNRSKGSVSQHCSALRKGCELSESGLDVTREGEVTLGRFYSDLIHLHQEKIPF
jgi:putative DNA primase/helicase